MKIKKISIGFLSLLITVFLTRCSVMYGAVQPISNDLFSLSVPADWKIEGGNDDGGAHAFDGVKDGKTFAYQPESKPYSPPLLMMEYALLTPNASQDQAVRFSEKQKHALLRTKFEQDEKLKTMVQQSTSNSAITTRQLQRNITEESIDIGIPASKNNDGLSLGACIFTRQYNAPAFSLYLAFFAKGSCDSAQSSFDAMIQTLKWKQ